MCTFVCFALSLLVRIAQLSSCVGGNLWRIEGGGVLRKLAALFVSTTVRRGEGLLY